jgi:hypothetical protein
LIIAIRQHLVADDPQPLRQKHRQQRGGNALRRIEAKAAKSSEPVSRHALWNLTSLNACARACVASINNAFQLAFFAGSPAAILLPCLQAQESRPEGRLSWLWLLFLEQRLNPQR